MGILGADEKRIEAGYLEKALEIVRSLWALRSVDDIALEIYHKTGFRRVSPRLVYALKARLDSLDRARAG